MACTFQTTITGKFAPLIGLGDEEVDTNTMITTYNTAVTDAASEVLLGKERHRKTPWVTKDVLDLCDESRDLKKKRYEAEGAKIHGSKQEDSEGSEESKGGLYRCSVHLFEEIETCLNKNNSKRAIPW